MTKRSGYFVKIKIKICLLIGGGCVGVVVGGNMLAERAVVVAMSEDRVSPMKDWMRVGSSATLLTSSESMC